MHLRHLAVVFEEVASAGTRDRRRAGHAGVPMNGIERMRSEIGHLAPGVVPEPAEVVEAAIRIVGALRRGTEPQIVVEIGWRRLVRRLAKARTDIAEEVALHRDQSSGPAVPDQFPGLLIVRAGPLLRPPLHAPPVTARDLDHPTPFTNK